MNTCSNCLHYHPFGTEPRGECWYNPPVAFSSGGSSYAQIRHPEHMYCHFHETGTPIKQVKVKPETPGLANKMRQLAKHPPKPVAEVVHSVE